MRVLKVLRVLIVNLFTLVSVLPRKWKSATNLFLFFVFLLKSGLMLVVYFLNFPVHDFCAPSLQQMLDIAKVFFINLYILLWFVMVNFAQIIVTIFISYYVN